MSAQIMEIKALTWRLFLQSKRRPIVLAAGLIQPFIWLLLFSTVFKNSPMATLHGADSYLAFITPGTLVFTAFTAALNGGVPILFDREQGFLDRLLVAPLCSRLSIVWASGFHIFIMTMLQCVVILLLTAVMGVSFQGGFMGLLVLLLSIGLVSLIFTTLSLLLAFLLRYHFELISLVMIVSLPMMFISTAFAPMEFMPTWLQYFVSLNPISMAVEAMRAVFFNADWTWSGAVFDSPIAGFSVGGCLGILALVNLAVTLLARSVFSKKLR